MRTREGTIDLAIVGGVLPCPTGSEFAEQYRLRWPEGRVIFLAMPDDGNNVRSVAERIPVVPKRLEPAVLSQAVREAMEMPGFLA